MITNAVDCRVYPYHPDCRGINTVNDNGHDLLGASNEQAWALLADDKTQVISFITTNVNAELISTLQSLIFSFGVIG